MQEQLKTKVKNFQTAIKDVRMHVSVCACVARKQEVKTEQAHWTKTNTFLDTRIIDKILFLTFQA